MERGNRHKDSWVFYGSCYNSSNSSLYLPMMMDVGIIEHYLSIAAKHPSRISFGLSKNLDDVTGGILR
jgi:hypothetical protein